MKIKSFSFTGINPKFYKMASHAHSKNGYSNQMHFVFSVHFSTHKFNIQCNSTHPTLCSCYCEMLCTIQMPKFTQLHSRVSHCFSC